MSYQEHLERAKEELSFLSTRKAVLEEKIKGLVESLNLDISKDLTPQIQELQKSLEEKKEKLTKELENSLKKLEELDE